MNEDGKGWKPPLSAERLRQLQELDENQPDNIDLRQLTDEERPSFWKKIADKGRTIAVKRGMRLAAREALVGEIPFVNVGIAVYEGYMFGKDMYTLIKEERELAKIENKASTKPFYELVEKERSKQVRELSDNVEKVYKAVNSRKSKGLSLGTHRDEISSYQKRESLNRSVVPEVLSKAASEPRFKNEADQLFNEAALVKGYVKQNFPAETAAHKYQYMLATAVEGLGRSHFNQVNFPGRGMRFDKFFAERAYMDGHDVQEIGLTILEKSPFALGLKDVDLVKQNEYIEKLTNFSHPELDEARNAISQWRQRKGLPEHQKLSPLEYAEHKTYTKAAAERREKNEIIKFAELEREYHEIQLNDANRFLHEYRKANDFKTTTTQEYMLELARMNQKGEILSNSDKGIVFKLIAAGHDEKDIINALHESSPFGHQPGYGKGIYDETIEQINNNPKQKDFITAVYEMKNKYNLPDENRLDRLGISHEQPGRSEYLGQGLKSEVNPSGIEKIDRSFDQLESSRDYEIRR
ncbi:MAG: hypothetical protein KME46_21800 [Brasilonema angustatum HA4187-MV1]|jgi:hypothetical protein|nr:hypothetical protein [Brasilonema angustatum HA4187-MV1]